MNRLNLVFFGTPQIAVPTLERISAGPHRVVGVVSQPDRGRGRGRKRSPSPVSSAALTLELPLIRAERVADSDVVREIESWRPDLGVVVAFGQFLPRRVRELPKLGYLINAHASLLPRYRGAAPIARALMAGEARTGISVMRIEREMDAGPVALVRSLEIDDRENAEELAERLGALAADAIEAALDQIAAGDVSWTAQDHDSATAAPKLGREDAILDWREGAVALARRVRALAPRPGAIANLSGEPLRVLAARPLATPETDATREDTPAPPGTLRVGGAVALAVATGDGWLEVLRLQRPGGKPLDAEAFLRGRPIADGALLDPVGHPA